VSAGAAEFLRSSPKTPFFLDVGFSRTQIGTIAKFSILASTIVASTIGGLIMLKLAINRALWVFGLVQLTTSLGFAALAAVGPNPYMLAAAAAWEYFGVGLGTVALLAFIAQQTDRRFTATQLALLTSLMVVPRTFAGSITGYIIEGPLLDSTLANPNDPAPGRPGQAYALWPMPLRHGMTIGELARYFNDVLQIRANLHVVPALGWRRDVWFDLTGLPWVNPSPNMPSVKSAMLYPGLVAFEATNLSVGRGTLEAFQHVGAPWLNAAATVALLRDREVPGVRFYAETFTPQAPSDGKYGGQTIPGIKIVVINRSALQAARVGATLLWAIRRTGGAHLEIRDREFDLRFGSPAVREALLRGDDPDVVIDHEYRAAYAFRERTRQYLIYR